MSGPFTSSGPAIMSGTTGATPLLTGTITIVSGCSGSGTVTVTRS
jgi:hypothetical protein